MTRTAHPDITTLGQCPHTKHRHGWWCVRCLRAMVPGVVVTRGTRGVWDAEWRGCIGWGTNRIHALQACIEGARMDGAL